MDQTPLSIQDLQKLLGQQGLANLKKALSVSSGFVGYNLEPQAKLMLPYAAPLRARFATDTPQQGAQYCTWKAQLGFGSFDFASSMGSAEAAVGTEVGGTATQFQAPYFTQAVEGIVNHEAVPMARGYDDAMAVKVAQSLATLWRLEELDILGGNYTALAAPTGVVAAAYGSGSITVPGYAQVTALTLQGYLYDLASGYSTLGESAPSTEVAVTSSGASKVGMNIYWSPVKGAVAYRVWGGSTGAEKLFSNAYFYYPSATTSTAAVTRPSTSSTCTTVTSLQIQHAEGTQAVPSADHSAQDGSTQVLVGDGLFAWCQKTTILSQTVTHYTYDMAGTVLTTTAAGIKEFDYILSNLWNTWKIGPSLILGSSNAIAMLTAQVLAANSAAMYRVDLTADKGGFTGGVHLTGYVNKYASSMLAGQPVVIPVWAHPEMPDGTFLFLTEKIPYAQSREPRGFALDVLQPYMYFPLAPTTRVFPFSLVFMETLKCYHPSAQASITGVRCE